MLSSTSVLCHDKEMEGNSFSAEEATPFQFKWGFVFSIFPQFSIKLCSWEWRVDVKSLCLADTEWCVVQAALISVCLVVRLCAKWPPWLERTSRKDLCFPGFARCAVTAGCFMFVRYELRVSGLDYLWKTCHGLGNLHVTETLLVDLICNMYKWRLWGFL